MTYQLIPMSETALTKSVVAVAAIKLAALILGWSMAYYPLYCEEDSPALFLTICFGGLFQWTLALVSMLNVITPGILKVACGLFFVDFVLYVFWAVCFTWVTLEPFCQGWCTGHTLQWIQGVALVLALMWGLVAVVDGVEACQLVGRTPSLRPREDALVGSSKV